MIATCWHKLYDRSSLLKDLHIIKNDGKCCSYTYRLQELVLVFLIEPLMGFNGFAFSYMVEKLNLRLHLTLVQKIQHEILASTKKFNMKKFICEKSFPTNMNFLISTLHLLVLVVVVVLLSCSCCERFCCWQSYLSYFVVVTFYCKAI